MSAFAERTSAAANRSVGASAESPAEPRESDRCNNLNPSPSLSHLRRARTHTGRRARARAYPHARTRRADPRRIYVKSVVDRVGHGTWSARTASRRLDDGYPRGLAGGFRETFRKPTLTMESSSRLAEPAADRAVLPCVRTHRARRPLRPFRRGEEEKDAIS